MNPLLEAFGNAKTERNNNSSRFGKFIEVHFNSKYRVDGAQFSHYLLERSRIVRQSKRERNYHMFYRLCCAPKEVKDVLGLTKPSDYHYLNQGEVRMFGDELSDTLLNDKADFVRTENAMKKIGMAKEKRMDVFKVVAAVLHIGNIEITESDSGGAQVSPAGIPAANQAASLLGLDAATLIEAITTRATKIPGEATLVKKSLTHRNAEHARDALAKALYARLFDQGCKESNYTNRSLSKISNTHFAYLQIVEFNFRKIKLSSK